MKPEELEALADRIDHEQLWRLPGMEHDKLTPEQRDRLDAGVMLRRYAHARGTVLEALKEGREYMRGFKLVRMGHATDARGCGDKEWHRSLNEYSVAERKAGRPFPHWMYTAKMISDEVPRMILLFEREREGKLAESYKMCGHDPRPATPTPDNHLRCALDVECRKCPHLAAIETQDGMTTEAKDEAKAWTCATHVLLESTLDAYLEQVLRDKTDDAFDSRMIASFAAEQSLK